MRMSLIGIGLLFLFGNVSRVSAEEKKLIPGCLVSVIVTDEEEVSGEQTLDANGEIGFHLGDPTSKHYTVWRVKLAGKTDHDAREAIRESLKKYFKEPELTFRVVRYPTKRIEVYGAVKSAGVLQLSLEGRLSDVLNAAGIASDADLTKVTILRKSPADPQKPTEPRKLTRIVVDYTATQPDADSDPLLQADDRVYLILQPQKPKEATIAIVRVFGEVEREGAFPMKSGTVRDALLLAGGLKPTANREKIVLIRARDAKYLPLDADKVMENDPVYNLPVEDRDMISVEKGDQSQFVSVEGEIHTPGRLPLKTDEKISLIALMERVGGPTKNADQRRGLIRKNYFRDPAHSRPIPFNYENVKKGREPNWEIESGDQVIFPPKVKRPSLLERALPLLLNFLPFGI